MRVLIVGSNMRISLSMLRGVAAGLLLLLLVLMAPASWAQSSLKKDRAAYRDKYKKMAIEQMARHGVPASITLAQGMLESGNGKSRLATQGHNHFGIKCHKGWKGKRMYHNDDARGECFRVYKSAEHSFDDHSLFLRGTRRYAFLFNLSPTDYKGWAHGLKKSGYATDPAYAKRLIEIIEEEGLAQYDTGVEVEVVSPTVDTGAVANPESEFEIQIAKEHTIYVRNRVKYVVVAKGDTYDGLSRTLEMMPWEIARYNELPDHTLPPPGSVVYIQPKRRKAEVQHKVHVAERGESIYSISQRYAVKSRYLYRRNRMTPGELPEEGQLIYLRGKAPVT